MAEMTTDREGGGLILILTHPSEVKLETMSFLKIFDAQPRAKSNPNNDAHRSS